MWYLLIQHDWYMHGGDRTFLGKHRNFITGLIDKIDPLVDKDGNERPEDNTRSQLKRFLDWPSSPNEAGVEAGCRALLSWAMQDAERLCQVLGDKVHAAKCRDIAMRLSKKVLDDNGLQQASALKVTAGLQQPTSGFDISGFSTFYGYYMLEAMARAGQYDEVLDIISRYWGSKLDLRATTFWEDFNMAWLKDAARIDAPVPAGKADVHREYGAYCYLSYRHSFCHGWASGSTARLSRHVLGVQVLEAGCGTLRIEPHLGYLQ